jgi:hypothetical protein
MVDQDYVNYVSSLKRGDVVDVEDVTHSYDEWSLFYDHLKKEGITLLDLAVEGYMRLT